VNAVEHGNLGIGFELKTALQQKGNWLAEIEKRLQLPENQAKKAWVDYRVEDGAIRYEVTDNGQGFNYREFLEINTERNLNIFGRGLAIARVLSFDKLVYTDPGNIVMVEAKASPHLCSSPLSHKDSGTGGL
jgi:anti-sigma regulatory factor (Ser/Thr protein kinase)